MTEKVRFSFDIRTALGLNELLTIKSDVPVNPFKAFIEAMTTDVDMPTIDELKKELEKTMKPDRYVNAR